MQGACSVVVYFDDYIIKEVMKSEEDEPLEVVASREVHLETLARTVYPHVPKIYSVEETKIKKERIFGVRLDKYLTDRPEDFERILQKVKELNRILVDAGIYHGDFGPHNMILDAKDHLWIFDFGYGHTIAPSEKWYIDHLYLFLDIVDLDSPLLKAELQECKRLMKIQHVKCVSQRSLQEFILSSI